MVIDYFCSVTDGTVSDPDIQSNDAPSTPKSNLDTPSIPEPEDNSGDGQTLYYRIWCGGYYNSLEIYGLCSVNGSHEGISYQEALTPNLQAGICLFS